MLFKVNSPLSELLIKEDYVTFNLTYSQVEVATDVVARSEATWQSHALADNSRDVPFYYREWAATKKKKGDSPLFYILIIMAMKRTKDEKRGLSPFFYT